MAPSSPVTSPSRKRRRVALACRTCRNRKSRCDGSRPKCSLCTELECDCTYQQGSVSSNSTVGKEYITQLEHRLENIEDFLRPWREAPQDGQPATPYSPQRGVPSAGRERRAIAHASSESNKAEMGEVDTSENSVDGMGAIKFTDEEDCGFFGPSSNIAFMRHISGAMARGNPQNQRISSAPPYESLGGGMMSVSRSRPVPDQGDGRCSGHVSDGVNIYSLPPESRTWNLIQRYFSKTGQLLPFIHEQSFCETYFQMERDRFAGIRRTWLGLLNIILAIATSLSIEDDMPAEKRIEESDIYYQRANGLCGRESTRSTSLEMVQYLLVLGQYLQGTQKSVQASNAHGLAITVAFQLGLHSPGANRRFAPLEREIRKRTWFGCILLDRTLSMTFGRPCAIPESFVKLDMPLKDLQVLGYKTQLEPGLQPDASFFTAAIKLSVIMYNVIDMCYGQNLGVEDTPTTGNMISQVLEGDRQLEEWQIQLLPTFGLQVFHKPLLNDDIEKTSPGDVIFQRFSVVLSLRYHNLRILLHRRFLERFLDTYGANHGISQEHKVLQRVAINSVQSCVESAVTIISTVHTIASSTGWRRDILGAWSYSLFYTFNAGLVIFGALLVSSKERLHNPSQWVPVEDSRPYLDLAAEALRRLDSSNRVIERCVEYLMQLSVALNYWASNGAAPQGSPSEFRGCSPTLTSQNNPHKQGWRSIHNQSPTGMELGELMMDNNLDFLGQLFNLSQDVDGQTLDSGENPETQGTLFPV